MDVLNPQSTDGDVKTTPPQLEPTPEMTGEDVTTLPRSSGESSVDSSCVLLDESGMYPQEPPTEFEYEFSFVLDGKPMFVHLWDSNDRSACERVLCHPVLQESISFSDTGNGFVTDKDGYRWAFHKEVYKRSWEHGEISAGTDVPETPLRRVRRERSADDILLSL